MLGASSADSTAARMAGRTGVHWVASRAGQLAFYWAAQKDAATAVQTDPPMAVRSDGS